MLKRKLDAFGGREKKNDDKEIALACTRRALHKKAERYGGKFLKHRFGRAKSHFSYCYKGQKIHGGHFPRTNDYIGFAKINHPRFANN